MNLIAQTIADDLDTLLRSGKVTRLDTIASDRDINELLCRINYDKIEQYCTAFLGYLLSSLLNLVEIHVLDSYTMETPKERLVDELKRRGIPVEGIEQQIKALTKIARR
jgi:hypothetical protein